MRYETTKNPLCVWYRTTLRRAKARNAEIYPEWETWVGFAKWASANGYDENSKFHYSSHNPFTPEYIHCTRYEDRDYEYIAYEATDPYELIITSASYIEELAEKLNRLGYDYDAESIRSALSRNETERPIEERDRGLIFERIDLTDYDDTDEPF